MITAIESWLTANSELIISLVIVIGLALLAWKTNFGKILVSILSALVRLRGVLVLLIILAILVLVAGEVL
ncbi:MAG: hypothetical protein ACOX10_01890 [Candidatus Methanomethylophilaceae archaeon]